MGEYIDRLIIELDKRAASEASQGLKKLITDLNAFKAASTGGDANAIKVERDQARERIAAARQFAKLQADEDKARAQRLAEFTRQDAAANTQRLNALAAQNRETNKDIQQQKLLESAIARRLRAKTEEVNVERELSAAVASVTRGQQLDGLAERYVRVTQSGRSAAIANDQLVQSLKALGATKDEIAGVAREIERVEAANARNAERNQGRLFQSGRLQGGALGRLGSELRLLPSVPIPGTSFGSDSVANLIRISGAVNTVLQSTGTSLGTVAKAAGIAGVAIGALVIAFDLFNIATRQFKSGVEAAIKAQNDYYEALRDNTTTQAREQIERLQRDNEVRLGPQRAETRNALGGAFRDPNETIVQGAQRLTNISSILSEVARSGSGIPALQEQYNALNAEFTANENTIARLTQGLELNTFAGNDFAAFLEEFKEAFQPPPPTAVEQLVGFRALGERVIQSATEGLIAGAQATVERNREAVFSAAEEAAQNRQQDAGFARQSAQGLRDERTSLFFDSQSAQDSINVIQASGDTSAEATAKIAEYNETIRQNGDDIARITATYLPLAEARETLVSGLTSELRATQLAAEQESIFADIRRSGSVDALKTQLRAEQERFSLANAQLPILQELSEADAEYTAELEATKDELELASANVAVLTKRIGELRAATAVSDAVAFAIDGAREVNDLVQKQQADIVRITEQFNERQAELLRRAEEADLDARLKYQFDFEKLGRDFEAQNLEDETKARESEQDLRDEFNDDQAKRLADHNRKLAEIERDFQFDFTSAVGNRDALAANEAERRRDKEIEDENARFAALTEERQADYEAQAKDLRENLDAQRKQRERDYERRKDELARAFRFDQEQRVRKYNADLTQLTQKFNAELSLQNQAFVAEFNALRSHLMNRFALENQYYGAIVGVLNRALGSIAQASIPSSAATLPAAVQPYYGNSANNPYIGYQGGRAAGGSVAPFRDFMVGENGPEIMRLPVKGQVFSAGQSQSMMNGGGSGPVPMSLRIDGQALAQLMDGRVVRVMAEVLN